MEVSTTRSAMRTRIAQRTRLRRALDRYVTHVARARHFTGHPSPQPADTSRAETHLDAARATELELIAALEALGAGRGDERTGGEHERDGIEPDDARRHGLSFGIGGREHLIGDPLVSAVAGKSAPLARRVEVAHVAERCLRLLARAEDLAYRPLDADSEMAVRQFGAAGRAERVLWKTLHTLAG